MVSGEGNARIDCPEPLLLQLLEYHLFLSGQQLLRVRADLFRRYLVFNQLRQPLA